jgi:hypothetical protein
MLARARAEGERRRGTLRENHADIEPRASKLTVDQL